jgi:hypothetical protein
MAEDFLNGADVVAIAQQVETRAERRGVTAR